MGQCIIYPSVLGKRVPSVIGDHNATSLTQWGMEGQGSPQSCM